MSALYVARCAFQSAEGVPITSWSLQGNARRLQGEPQVHAAPATSPERDMGYGER